MPFALARGQNEPVITRRTRVDRVGCRHPTRHCRGVLKTMGFLVLGLTQVHDNPALGGLFLAAGIAFPVSPDSIPVGWNRAR